MLSHPAKPRVHRSLAARLSSLAILLTGVACQAAPAPTTAFAPSSPPPAAPLADTFTAGLAHWVVEQQPGGRVEASAGRLLIEDKAGCTVWYRPRLTAPVTITYEATVRSSARVSDLNCFWMASDPRSPDDLFAPAITAGRTGLFAGYDALQLYYVGYGGNANTTTRFRRYTGGGPKPLRPEHDRREPAALLRADHVYQIRLEARDGVARFWRDGELLFEFADPAPLTSGWFGFRTVDSHLEIRNFRVQSASLP